MADNTLQNGTDTIATDDVTTLNGSASSGIKVQRVKVGSGSDNTFNDATAANGLPVLQNDVSVTGSLAATNSFVTLPLNGQSAATVQITGTWVGTIQFEGTLNGTDWGTINAVASSTSFPQPTTTVNGLYRLTPGALMQMRALMPVFTSGSAAVSIRASAGTGGIFANQILPARITDGTSTVTIKPASTAAVAADASAVVTIHPSTATMPVSAASLPLPTGASTETTLAGVRTDLGTDGTTPPTVLGTGTGVRGWLRSIYEKLTGTLAVSGAFFQATQPVSLATNTPDVTDRAARLLGVVTGAAAAPLALDATLTNHTLKMQAVTALTTISVANTAVTLTLPAVAAQFHYLSRIRITMINTSATAVAGSAAIIAFTSTNLPGALAWSEGTALAAGTSKVVVDEILENSLKSSTVNTATTIVAPVAGVGVQVRITAYYYTAA